VNHGVDTGTVGKASVNHGGRLVDAPAHLAHDLVDDSTKVDFVDKSHIGPNDLASLLDVHVERPVDHDLGNFGIVQEGVDGTVSEDIGGDLVEKLTAIAHCERNGLLLIDGPLEHLHDPETQLGVRHLPVVKSGTQLLHYLEMQAASQLGESFVACAGDG
jgi:hypothetical protein